ncbi:MAG TPA: tetratricopeptide repeat protein [Candidatus Hydrogenedentes bacterium]|nr:tetratricopeptide repeat protein [Candidatus Hydrogenedentota bacterium]
MDLSGLKWPLIIVVVVVVGWLLSSGGVNWMEKNFTKSVPGQDEKRDISDEAGLARLGGYCMYLFRYEKAASIFEKAIDRYPNGANYYYCKYCLARCYEKMDRYQDSYNILLDLIAANASEVDKRVNNNDVLNLRAQKLKEVHGF